MKKRGRKKRKKGLWEVSARGRPVFGVFAKDWSSAKKRAALELAKHEIISVSPVTERI